MFSLSFDSEHVYVRLKFQAFEIKLFFTCRINSYCHFTQYFILRPLQSRLRLNSQFVISSYSYSFILKSGGCRVAAIKSLFSHRFPIRNSIVWRVRVIIGSFNRVFY